MKKFLKERILGHEPDLVKTEMVGTGKFECYGQIEIFKQGYHQRWDFQTVSKGGFNSESEAEEYLSAELEKILKLYPMGNPAGISANTTDLYVREMMIEK